VVLPFLSLTKHRSCFGDIVSIMAKDSKKGKKSNNDKDKKKKPPSKDPKKGSSTNHGNKAPPTGFQPTDEGGGESSGGTMTYAMPGSYDPQQQFQGTPGDDDNEGVWYEFDASLFPMEASYSQQQPSQGASAQDAEMVWDESGTGGTGGDPNYAAAYESQQV
jgi:hypothetical protein